MLVFTQHCSVLSQLLSFLLIINKSNTRGIYIVIYLEVLMTFQWNLTKCLSSKKFKKVFFWQILSVLGMYQKVTTSGLLTVKLICWALVARRGHHINKKIKRSLPFPLKSNTFEAISNMLVTSQKTWCVELIWHTQPFPTKHWCN